MATDQQAKWAEYYRKLHSASPNPWLDLSNEAVQAQTFAVAIEAAGAIGERRCLDIGCGYGQLSTCLHGLRASEVVGVDIVGQEGDTLHIVVNINSLDALRERLEQGPEH